MKFRHKRTTTDKKQWPWSLKLNVKTGPVVVKNTLLLPVATVLQRECQSSWIAQHGTSVKVRCSCGVTSREEQYISAALREQLSVLSVDPSILFIQNQSSTNSAGGKHLLQSKLLWSWCLLFIFISYECQKLSAYFLKVNYSYQSMSDISNKCCENA